MILKFLPHDSYSYKILTFYFNFKRLCHDFCIGFYIFISFFRRHYIAEENLTAILCKKNCTAIMNLLFLIKYLLWLWFYYFLNSLLCKSLQFSFWFMFFRHNIWLRLVNFIEVEPHLNKGAQLLLKNKIKQHHTYKKIL